MIFYNCPYCKGFIPLIRKHPNTGLMIFLFFFTFGIGFLIYLFIWKRQSSIYCSNCGINILKNTIEVQEEFHSHFCKICGHNLSYNHNPYCDVCLNQVLN